MKENDILHSLAKEFLYFFIIGLGISPFVKFFEGKSIFQACVENDSDDTTMVKKSIFRELLTHTYIVHYKSDYN